MTVLKSQASQLSSLLPVTVVERLPQVHSLTKTPIVSEITIEITKKGDVYCATIEVDGADAANTNKPPENFHATIKISSQSLDGLVVALEQYAATSNYPASLLKDDHWETIKIQLQEEMTVYGSQEQNEHWSNPTMPSSAYAKVADNSGPRTRPTSLLALLNMGRCIGSAIELQFEFIKEPHEVSIQPPKQSMTSIQGGLGMDAKQLERTSSAEFLLNLFGLPAVDGWMKQSADAFQSEVESVDDSKSYCWHLNDKQNQLQYLKLVLNGSKAEREKTWGIFKGRLSQANQALRTKAYSISMSTEHPYLLVVKQNGQTKALMVVAKSDRKKEGKDINSLLFGIKVCIDFERSLAGARIVPQTLLSQATLEDALSSDNPTTIQLIRLSDLKSGNLTDGFPK